VQVYLPFGRCGFAIRAKEEILIERGAQPKPARIQDIWMTQEKLEDMVIAKTLFVVDALLEGRVLQDDGTVAGARERMIASLKRLKAKRLKSGWMIPREDLRAVISFD
jgi:hypothetical protein